MSKLLPVAVKSTALIKVLNKYNLTSPSEEVSKLEDMREADASSSVNSWIKHEIEKQVGKAALELLDQFRLSQNVVEKNTIIDKIFELASAAEVNSTLSTLSERKGRGSQEDSQEFVSGVLDLLYAAEKGIPLSAISTIKPPIKESENYKESIATDPVTMIQLELKEGGKVSELFSKHQAKEGLEEATFESKDKKTTNKKFTKKEGCTKTFQYQVRKDIEEFTLQLKRFENNGRTSNKIDRKIDLDPIDLKIEESNKSRRFKVTSFVCHKGSLSGGHYRCYVKTRDKGWVHYDDSLEVEENVSDAKLEVDMKNAYICKYSADDATLPLAMKKGSLNSGNSCWANAGMAFISSLCETFPPLQKAPKTRAENITELATELSYAALAKDSARLKKAADNIDDYEKQHGGTKIWPTIFQEKIAGKDLFKIVGESTEAEVRTNFCYLVIAKLSQDEIGAIEDKYGLEVEIKNIRNPKLTFPSIAAPAPVLPTSLAEHKALTYDGVLELVEKNPFDTKAFSELLLSIAKKHNKPEEVGENLLISQLLVAKGAEITAQVLQAVAANNNDDLQQFLEGENFLSQVRTKHSDIIKDFEKFSAITSLRSVVDGSSALHNSVQNSDPKVFAKIVENFAAENIDKMPDNNGVTPLMAAVMAQNVVAVKDLSAKTSNLQVVNRKGQTAQMLVENGAQETVQILQEREGALAIVPEIVDKKEYVFDGGRKEKDAEALVTRVAINKQLAPEIAAKYTDNRLPVRAKDVAIRSAMSEIKKDVAAEFGGMRFIEEVGKKDKLFAGISMKDANFRGCKFEGVDFSVVPLEDWKSIKFNANCEFDKDCKFPIDNGKEVLPPRYTYRDYTALPVDDTINKAWWNNIKAGKNIAKQAVAVSDGASSVAAPSPAPKTIATDSGKARKLGGVSQANGDKDGPSVNIASIKLH